MILRISSGMIAFIVLIATASPARSSEGSGDQGSGNRRPASRQVAFTYAGVVNELPPGAEARVWLPIAQSRPGQQEVEIEKIEAPGSYQMTVEPKYGNRMLYFSARASADGEIPFEIRYRIRRWEICCGEFEEIRIPEREKYLAASNLIPTNKGLLKELLPQRDRLAADGFARALYDAIEQRMRYDKPLGESWGRGDAVWACDSRFGNCTDFHSVFIAACREANVPARFEIGFPLPAENGQGPIGGYHCWAFFEKEGQWVPVDISEADKHPEMKDYYFGNLTADRVAMSRGRDLNLVPSQDAGPVNFLVYPHVEVDGRVHAAFEKKFACRRAAE